MFERSSLDRRLAEKKRAAVAIVLHESSALLMLRATREGDPWSGHVSLPGGGYQIEDDHLKTTAIRETREELGIDLASATYLGQLAALQPLMSGPRGIEVTPFVFAVPERPTPQLGDEAVATFWLPLDRAAAKDFDGEHAFESHFVTPPKLMKFPCWNFEGHVIWGLTWRILSDLMSLAVP